MPVIPIHEDGFGFSHLDANVPFAIEDAVVDGSGNLDITIGAGRIRWGDVQFEITSNTIVTQSSISDSPSPDDDYYAIIDYNGGSPQLNITTTPPSSNTNAEFEYLGYVTTDATPVVTGITDLRGFLPPTTHRAFDGSASTPSITFTGDTGTGFFLNGTDEVGLSGHLLPGSDATYSIGSASLAWETVAISGGKSAADLVLNFVHRDYAIYVDEDAAGSGNRGRMWLNAPHAGEIGIGPRGSNDTLNRLLIRGNTQVEGSVDIGDGSSANPALAFVGDHDTGLFRSGGDDLSFTCGGGTRTFTMDASSSPGFRPGADNQSNLGDPSFRWVAVYAVDGTINTSDVASKEQIEDSDLGLDFLLDVGTKKWKRKVGGRPHYGPVAQDVKAAMDARGVDFAGYVDPSHALDERDANCPWEGDSPRADAENADANCEQYHAEIAAQREQVELGLRHHEFIGPIITALGEISARLDAAGI